MRRVLSALSFVALLGCSVIGCGKQGVGERCDKLNTPPGTGLGGDCEDTLQCNGRVCCVPTDLTCMNQASDAGTTDGATETATDVGSDAADGGDTTDATDAPDASETTTDASAETATEAGTDAADGG